MALRSTKQLHFLYVFMFVALYVLFRNAVSSSTSAKPGRGEWNHFRSLLGVSGPTAPPPGVRLHPGVVASVVLVTVAAILAAVFIIRKYCFPHSDATYRYSVLRRMEEQREEVSDEELLD